MIGAYEALHDRIRSQLIVPERAERQLSVVPAAEYVEPRFEPSLNVLQADYCPASVVQRLSEVRLAPVDEPARLPKLCVAPRLAVTFLERQSEHAARASGHVTGAEGTAQVVAVEVQKDRVGKDSVEGSAQGVAPDVQKACLMTGLPEPLHERGRRIGAVDPQPTVFEILRIPARPAPDFEHLAVRHIRDDRV